MRVLPGIRIVDLPSPAGDGLPVMDVPVFVGFAQRGPLDRPVALEDPAQYTAVFGGVLDLVPRQSERRAAGASPRMQRAHLPAAVASFFAGGGRRCYVIRVANRETAGEALFPVAGLRLATFNRDLVPARWQLSSQDFKLRAASPGAWADRHELAVRLRSSALHALDPVHRGDLLRVRQPGDETRVGWLRVDRAGSLAAILDASAPSAWLWTPAAGDEAPNTSPPAASSGLDGSSHGEVSPPAPLLAPPPDTVTAERWLIERVTVDLALRHPREGPRRREACGLAAGAANLPWFEADAGGRFDAGEPLPGANWPLAGVPASTLAGLAYGPDGMLALDPPADDWILLPVAVDNAFGPWRPALTDGRDALSRNGLAEYSSGLFTDPAWSERLRGAELLRWADDIRFFAARPRRLAGLHGALGRDDAVARDATWIAVPDAVHPGWQLEAALPRRDGQLLATADEACNGAPSTAFAACQEPPPPIPRPPRFTLDALRAASGGSAISTADGEWFIFADDDHRSPPSNAPVSFEAQIAQQADFSDQQALPIAAGTADESPQWQAPHAQAGCAQAAVKPGPRYFAPTRYRLRLAAGLYFLRARSWRAGRYSDWSETAELQSRASGWRLRAEQDPGTDSVTLTVHCALLDLCAASREHFALLSVPEGWDAFRLADHTAALRAHAARDIEASQAASFAAVHHPWLLRREPASEGAGSLSSGNTPDELHAHPPLGALLGSYARRSRNQGAWAAAALETLAEAVALATTVDAEGIEAAAANPIEVRPARHCRDTGNHPVGGSGLAGDRCPPPVHPAAPTGPPRRRALRFRSQ